MIRTALAILALGVSLGAQAANTPLDDAIAALGHGWAKASYSTPDDQQEKAFDALISRSESVAKAYPGRAEPLIWEAIILSSAAKAQGGLGALSKVRAARKLLEQAEGIDPTALNGSIYNSLGTLYAKVPGWPLGFGDKDNARKYLLKALQINPDGIDPNYFYADLLAEEGKTAEARTHLERALAAPPRPGREDADAGRRAQVKQLLAKLNER
ncbi:hypothetical protein G3580_00585 [Nitrogeniibacter mangrovi]|uniref:Uncharacterized protein n=1 Tax=Nitrogeniibacter mangrovi TaxID=2016596 RepID=A0A6C1B0A6_9RHOO|nr:hypothetical protein [Nitrogeniibacter mangrovi]QID16248.1 hypothetical protein G3580_00585 [Nitrogeniibacter mangrovi]